MPEVVLKYLTAFLKDYDKSETFLEKEKWVADLCVDYKLEYAMDRARKFAESGASYSNIYKAFDKFKK
jgi:hypothetical protein